MNSLKSGARIKQVGLFGVCLLGFSGLVAAQSSAVGKTGTPVTKPAPALVSATSKGVATTPAKPQPGLGDLPVVIQKMIKEGQGVRFLDRFSAPGGLSGYVLSSSNGERRIFYVTPDGKQALYGLMFDENLLNVTAEHQRTYIDVSEFLSSANINEQSASFADMAQRLATFAIAEEGQGLEIFLFVDPADTSSLRKVLSATRPLIKSLRIHWIPAAPAKGDPKRTLEVTAAIMSTKERMTALQMVADGKTLPDKVTEDGVDRAAYAVDGAGLIRTKQGGMSLPFVAYYDETNRSRFISGAPKASDWKALEAAGQKVIEAQRFKAQREAEAKAAPKP